MGRNGRGRAVSASFSAVLIGFSSAGLTQGLDEIIVTAERREMSLQDTPISVAVFGAESMELKGIETLEDIAEFTPNLDLKGSRFDGNNSPVWQIRGLSGGAGATGQRAAGLYIDGIFMPRTTGPFLNVLDVERIEILRGPQGTLFGRNSTGGAIRIFSQKPTPDRESYVKVGLGNFERQDVSVMVNAPVSDQFRLRAQVASLNQDGYIRRGSQLLGSQEDTIARLQTAFLPNDDLTVNLNLTYNKSESDGGAQDLAVWDMRPDLNFQGNYADWLSDFLEAAGQPRLDIFNDPRVVLDDYTMPDWCFLDDPSPDWDSLCEQYNDSELTQLDATVEWQINERLTLTSITGVSRFESEAVTDSQLLGFSWAPTGLESDVIYQEVQVNATLGEDRVDLVAGLTYFNEQGASAPDASLTVIGTSVFATQTPAGNGWSGLRSQNIGSTEPDADSYGLFFNATVNMTDKLRLTPGVRWAYDKQKITQTVYRSGNFTPFVGDFTRFHASEDWDEVDWRLTMDRDIGENHMFYVTASKAYRAGAYTPPAPVPQNRTGEDLTASFAVTPPFTPPETVENAEIGFRTEWLDGRLRLNLTYFDMLYTDRQGARQVNDPTQQVGFRIVVINTGDVDIWGTEFDGQFAVTDSVALDFSAGSVDTKIHDVCLNNGDFFFPGPVEQSYSLGARWLRPLSSGRNLTFSLSYAYTGDQETHSGGTADPLCGPAAQNFFDSRYTNEAYGLWNGRVRYDSDNGRWSGTLYVNNITDEVYSNNASRAGGGFWDAGDPTSTALSPAVRAIAAPMRSVVQHVRGRPREYGVTFQYNFGGRSAVAR
jgi:iron complex outermembrane recepter protein